MMTIRHIRSDGRERLVSVVSLDYDAEQNTLVGELDEKDDEPIQAVTFKDGIVYAMNENGKTVAIYNLSAGKSKPAATGAANDNHRSNPSRIVR